MFTTSNLALIGRRRAIPILGEECRAFAVHIIFAGSIVPDQEKNTGMIVFSRTTPLALSSTAIAGDERRGSIFYTTAVQPKI